MANEKGTNQEKPKKRGRVKETFAELKKVTWPTFGQTVKQTGAVLVVTLFFLVILLVMDQLLGLAHRQLIKGLTDTSESIVAAFKVMAGGIKESAGYYAAKASALPLLF